jgi:hypothetical protein
MDTDDKGEWHLSAKYKLENLANPSLGVKEFINSITSDMLEIIPSQHITPDDFMLIGKINDPQMWRLVGDFDDNFHLQYASRCYPHTIGSFTNFTYLEDWMIHPDSELSPSSYVDGTYEVPSPSDVAYGVSYGVSK